MTRALPFILLFAIAGLLPGTASAQKAFFADLHVNGEGMRDQYPHGLSDDGTTVVGAAVNRKGDKNRDNDEWWPVRWTPEGLEKLTAEPLVLTILGAADASADGSVIVGHSIIAPPLGPDDPVRLHAFRWTQENGIELLGLPPDAYYGDPFAISADGRVIVGRVGYPAFPVGFVHASVWSEDGESEDLGDLPGGEEWSQASGVSGDGSVVVGGASPEPCGYVPFRWTQSEGMTSLGSLLPPGADIDDCRRGGSANAISVDGNVIVGVSQREDADGSIQTAAFRWTEGEGLVDLDANTSGFSRSYATDVSALGSVVVGSRERSGAKHRRAWVWTQETGVTPLKPLLKESLGPKGRRELRGWKLRTADRISADGSVLIGTGKSPQGRIRPWIAYVPSLALDAAVPSD